MVNRVIPVSRQEEWGKIPMSTLKYHSIMRRIKQTIHPVACFIVTVVFRSAASCFVITILSFLGSLKAGIILYTAAATPTSLLVGAKTGEILIVTVWVLGGLLLTYSKVSIATIFRPLGSRELMWIGVMQQVGFFLGAVLFYLIINVWSLFESAPFCPVLISDHRRTDVPKKIKMRNECKIYPHENNLGWGVDTS